MASAISATASPQWSDLSRSDQTLLLFARLMEGGLEDDETVAELGKLTKMLNDDGDFVQKGEPTVADVIDSDCVDTVLCYLDMRNADIVRAHAALCTSAYLKAAGEDGRNKLSEFFMGRIRKSTYDDYIVAFCVASAIFPIVPDLTSELFLSEGFLGSLGPLMRRKWKSRKVETACLEMLNAACTHAACRDAVLKYCSEWLEEIIDQDPEEAVTSEYAHEPDMALGGGSISMRRHSAHVQELAAVVLAKIRVTKPPPNLSDPAESRVQPATTSVEDLSKMLTKMLLKSPQHSPQSSIEGLAYASLRPRVKEDLSKNQEFLKGLVKTLEDAAPRSAVTYGALSILSNITVYPPTMSEEEKRMSQLKAYANAAGKIQPDPLNNHDSVTARCKRVFDANVLPVLVTHSKNGSVASLSLIISIVNSLAVTAAHRGPLAQQGAIRLLISAWNALPDTEIKTKRTAAQALARILISTNPALVFGGTRPIPQTSAIRPLTALLLPDPTSESSRDLLPTFEALMALTNLASTDDDTRHAIVRTAWPDVEELLLSPNAKVTTAAVELVCNLVQSQTDALSLFADGTPQAGNRLKILVALADAEEEGTRSAAGGALASLTNYEGIVKAIAERERGAENVLGLCKEESEDLRHRGAFVVLNMAATEGPTGKLAREKLRGAGAVAILTECAKKSRSAGVVEVVVEALRVLIQEE
ncbi:myosin-binding striated muscle assembly central-domain-containing protein [Podospora conica]|nr:myosin-binding striated muscle assembly central-domain-containing protein [Schizothecium conicum]